MIQAMVGRRISEIAAAADPGAPRSTSGRPSAGRTPPRATRSATRRSTSAAARSWRSTASSGPARRRSARPPTGCARSRPARMEIDGKAATINGPAAGVHAGRRVPARRPQGRRRRSWSARSSENVAVASWGRLATLGQVITRRIRGAGLPALARQAVDPVAQRSAPGDGHALGRQPAEGAARPLARARQPRPRPHRADPRRRRRRPPGHLQARCASSPRMASPSSSAPRTTRKPSRSRTGSTSWPRGTIVADLAGDSITTTQLLAAAGG